MEQIIYTIPLEEFMDKLEKIVRDAIELKNEVKESTVEKYVKTAYAARMFKVTPKTIQNWRKSGELPFYRIKRGVYFKRSELEAKVNESKRNRGL